MCKHWCVCVCVLLAGVAGLSEDVAGCVAGTKDIPAWCHLWELLPYYHTSSSWKCFCLEPGIFQLHLLKPQLPV